MTSVVIFQPANNPVAILSVAPGVDIYKEATRIVPKGLPFWIVSKLEIDELYSEQGDWRNAWELDQNALGRKPDGFGEAVND